MGWHDLKKGIGCRPIVRFKLEEVERSKRRPAARVNFARQSFPSPPAANPEAEQSVLGAILVLPEMLGRVADLIEPADFYQEDHGRIFQAMLDLYGRGSRWTW